MSVAVLITTSSKLPFAIEFYIKETLFLLLVGLKTDLCYYISSNYGLIASLVI
jgi:hypothetical protein